MARQYVWVKGTPKVKFKANEKEKILKQVQEGVTQFAKLQERVSRVSMRGNRVYLHELVEQHLPEGVFTTEPLIDGKYLEFNYARITLKDTAGTSCTLDWQRPNDQWISLYEGSLQECLVELENNNDWFI